MLAQDFEYFVIVKVSEDGNISYAYDASSKDVSLNEAQGNDMIMGCASRAEVLNCIAYYNDGEYNSEDGTGIRIDL